MLMIRYRVKPDRAGENEAAIRAVFAELERDRPDGIRYVSFKLADGVSFVHIALVETPDGKNPLQAVEAFKRFSATVRDRIEEGPITTEATEIGSYRMLDKG